MLKSRLKLLHFKRLPASSLLVLTPPSTISVPATRKIYYASLQAERYPQVTSHFPRFSTPTFIDFAGLTDTTQAEACSGSRQQADLRTQGNGFSVQGDEVAASSDVWHEASDRDPDRPLPLPLLPFPLAQAKQGHQRIREASDRPGEVYDSGDSDLCCQSKAASCSFQRKHELAVPNEATWFRIGLPSKQTPRRPCSSQEAPVCLISHPLLTAEGWRQAGDFPFQAHFYCGQSGQCFRRFRASAGRFRRTYPLCVMLPFTRGGP